MIMANLCLPAQFTLLFSRFGKVAEYRIVFDIWIRPVVHYWVFGHNNDDKVITKTALDVQMNQKDDKYL